MSKVLVIAGPSAVGKTTVVKHLSQIDTRFTLVRSATTRRPRGDGHDAEYIYLTKEEFSRRIELGMMLEYMEYAGNFYGTPASEIDEIIERGGIPVLIIDLVGVRSISEARLPYAVRCVYIYAEEKVLAGRLYERLLASGDTEDARCQYEKRIRQNREDYRGILKSTEYIDAFIENRTVDCTAEEILRVYNADNSNLLDIRDEGLIAARRLAGYEVYECDQ